MTDLSDVSAALQKGLMNPLTLGGMGLMSGQGFNGLMTGMQGAQALQKNQHELQQQKMRDSYIQGLDPNDPRFSGLNPALVDVARGTNDPQILAKGLLGKSDQDFELQKIARQGGIQQALEFAKMRYAKELGLQDIENRAKLAERISGGMLGGQQQPPVQGAKQASDGNWYVADPNRPGKYLMVKP